MAPRSRSVKPTPNGNYNGMELTNGNHLPPPSTIAAQIVHNRANVARQEPENKALFGKLLQEYLHDPIIEDSNVDTNAQLIQVVAEAGLDILLSDDPFAPDNLIEQARDSLLVIRLTIVRKPDVLFYQSEDSDEKPPLLLWILAKILRLIGRRTLAAIQDDLCMLLSSILMMIAGKNRALTRAESIYTMLEQLVEDVILSLENYHGDEKSMVARFHVAVPSAQTMTYVWSHATSLLVLPPGYQADVRDPTQAQVLVVQLLGVLNSGLQDSKHAQPVRNMDESWLIDCCYRVLDVSKEATELPGDELTRVLEAMSKLIMQDLGSRGSKCPIRPTIDLVVALFDSVDVQQHSKAVVALCEVLKSLIMLCPKGSKRNAYVRRVLLPTIQHLANEITETVDDGLQATLERAVEQLSPRSHDLPEGDRPSKRQRLETIEADAHLQLRSDLVSNITQHLTGAAREHLPELDIDAVEKLADLNEELLIDLTQNLGLLPCVLARSTSKGQNSTTAGQCRVCDRIGLDSRGAALRQLYNESTTRACMRIVSFMALCVENSRLRRAKAHRVAFTDVIRRAANHFQDEEGSLLEWQGIGTWLMRSIQHPARELRVASAEALVSYLREDLPKAVREHNHSTCFNFFRMLDAKEILHVQETLTFAWGLIGRSCGKEALNLALMQLVDYLGHSHPIVSGAAYHELLQLAVARDCSSAELFKPYWRSLAMHVVKDIYVYPQKVQQLADLLGMSVGELLIHTQTETIPRLVLTRKKDVLQRIAQARGASISVHDLWLQPAKNLGAVLALLLVQPSEDAEQQAIALLTDASPSFGERDLSNLVRIEPTITACEILKYAADYEDAQKEQAHQGLRLLAMINERKSGSSKSSKSNKTLGTFLEAHILGIMSHFTDIIDSPLEKQSLVEKKRALRAIEQLIKTGDSRISIAIPQIRATLQSASKVSALADPAFLTWSSLVDKAGEDDVESLIDQTFAVIAHHWTSLSSGSQARAHDTIAGLLKNHNSMIRDRIQMLPSLAGIEMLQKFESEINRLKATIDPVAHFEAFAKRCSDENAIIVHRALLDLVPFLELHQNVIHESAVSQQPSPVIARLSRALLDAVVRLREHDTAIPGLAAKCIGAIGSIDPNKVDESREKHDLLMLSNFAKAEEVIDFAVEMLERVLVDAFHSAPTGRVQTYLAYAMQELLKFCGFRSVLYKARSTQTGTLFQRWMDIPETTRNTLMPFFNTRYALVHPSIPGGTDSFPILKPGMTHGTWLRTFVFNLLHQATTENTQMIFPVLSRIIWGHDISIPTFLLPFVALNIIVAGNDDDVAAITSEFLRVLSIDFDALDDATANEIKQCSENIFQVLDYLSRFLQAKKKQLISFGNNHSRAHHDPDFNEITEMQHISSVEAILSAMPADVISRRAVHCRSFARALLHWEQHIRQLRDLANSRKSIVDMNAEYRQLQDIYAQIEEPDAVEGMSTKLQILDPEQQILEHKRAGRWTAAQNWYELSLAERPDDRTLQLELLSCLKSSNRYSSLLDTAQSLSIDQSASTSQMLPFVAEAAWATGRWESLQRFLEADTMDGTHDFNTQLGRVFMALKNKDVASFTTLVSNLRDTVACGISSSSTSSLATAHSLTIKLHALYEVEQIGAVNAQPFTPDQLVDRMNKRLDILGALTPDKQYLLGIRRAAMHLSSLDFSKQQLGANWLASARLARNAGLREAAYDAVLHATNLHDGAAMIEHSRLLWHDGHHRKAIQNLQSAIESNVFQSYTTSMLESHTTTEGDGGQKNQNFLVAKTRLLLAKWMDKAGHSKSEELRVQFLQACKSFNRWEKGHYYMGKHYLKIFDSEKALPKAKQTDVYLTGDIHKLVIENFMRSMVFGAKYLYETVPKMLTLWLDLAADIHNAERNPRALDQQNHSARVRKLETVHKQVKKYIIERLPSYIFYTALPQVTSRINHAHSKASETLLALISKIIGSHPQQALWTILAVAKSRASDKASKAAVVLNQLKRIKPDNSAIDIKSLIMHGERLTVALLAACEVNVESRASRASLQRDLGFSHKLAPCQLVVPVEKALAANLPTGMGGATIRGHKAFARNPITISSFQDDVLVLSSLQRPKKLTMRGSDGMLYGLLCKPKDDLRKDQRLMEFTTMIDRGLKRDVESSKRRLYIHTYAVTPLNEECGAIEWVDGLKPMRDIILANYKAKGVRPDYGEIRQLLDKACADPEAGSYKVFTDQIITKFPAVLHEWFIDTFPEPDAWFTARLRYTRSCAVMSMVGNALGLGDRHGENILLEEGNGGCFHVDFNCLFDKGLTFEKPELVPFRLTHNVVDAFGIYGYEGPFRMAAELTLKTLKQYEDTLMTIMETFVYDPTTDFVSKPKKRVQNVPETPAEVLDSVKAKINGLLPGETVPLSVDGYADALIRMAVDPRRLSGMYIGWCAFF